MERRLTSKDDMFVLNVATPNPAEVDPASGAGQYRRDGIGTHHQVHYWGWCRGLARLNKTGSPYHDPTRLEPTNSSVGTPRSRVLRYIAGWCCLTWRVSSLAAPTHLGK